MPLTARMAVLGFLWFCSTSMCADDLKPGTDATVHRAMPYHFAYESLVTKEDGAKLFKFARRVFNLSNTEMFVDWKKTNVMGFAQANDHILSELPSITGDFDLLDTELWFGAAPKKIASKYKEAKKVESEKLEVLESRIRMAIPKAKEEMPAEFVALDVLFRSKVTDVSGLFEYSYSWPDSEARKRIKEIPFQFRQKSVTEYLANETKGKAGNTMRLGGSPREVVIISKEAPKMVLVTVEFRDSGNKNILGTAPVALYLPKGLKLE